MSKNDELGYNTRPECRISIQLTKSICGKSHLILIIFFSLNTLESRESATTISTVYIILSNNKFE